MVERMLGDDDVGRLEGFEDLHPLIEGDDGGRLVRRYEFVRAHADNQNVAQAAGVIDHPKMIVVEHVECP